MPQHFHPQMIFLKLFFQRNSQLASWPKEHLASKWSQENRLFWEQAWNQTQLFLQNAREKGNIYLFIKNNSVGRDL